MALKIRPIILKDAASFRQCVGAVAAERRYLAFYGPFPYLQVKAFLRRMLHEKNPSLVVTDGDRIVGWADVTRVNAWTSSHVGTLGMGLLPEYRGKGLGKKLLAGVLKLANTKFDQVDLTVYRQNKRARNLYKKAGFAWCGTKKGAAKLSYGIDDVLIMQKHLRRR